MNSRDRIEAVESFASGSSVFVRITTETGVRGIGESTAFAFPLAVVAVIDALRPSLIGSDPFEVNRQWLKSYRALGWRGLTLGGAISAIDQALWDFRGHYYEEPVWQLLGGQVRRRVRAMKVLPTGSLEEVVKHAQSAQDDGYSAIKVLLHQHEHHQMGHSARIVDLTNRLGAIRSATGDEMDIGVELHRNMQPGNSVALIENLAQFRPLFVEDPIPPDSALSFGEVSAKSRVPMAAGERNTTIYEFREYVEMAGVSFIRPDIGLAGGFTHLLKICALAEAHHQGIIPHAVPSGPVATTAHIHLGMVVPNWEVQEHVDQDIAPFTSMVDQVPLVTDGYLLPRAAPGLGISLNDDFLSTASTTVFPLAPEERVDGSVAMR